MVTIKIYINFNKNFLQVNLKIIFLSIVVIEINNRMEMIKTMKIVKMNKEPFQIKPFQIKKILNLIIKYLKDIYENMML